MKIRKDVTFALATVAAVILALFTLFVTIPVWFEAVAITLAVVCMFATVSAIVKAHRASYDEETGKYVYKFPVRAFILGILVIVAIASIVLLSLKQLYGFALIPVAVLLALLFVIALLKKLRTMKWIIGLLFVILVVALVGYFSSTLIHSGVELNPGFSVETTTPETETTVPETESTVPETEPTVPETEATVPETEPTVPETEPTVPETEPIVPETEPTVPETEPTVPETEPTVPENEITTVVKINAPETMSYAVPVTITLEGAKAENLIFGNEEFLSVVIVSDSEVEITLVGIVNAAGKVEVVPASGYITVTDSVSGVSATIEIVDNNVEETVPSEPEIEEEEDDEPTKEPVEDVEKPEETKPTEPETEVPEDDYTSVIVKINAPETMSYAVPITITLEGAKAENLIFGNEEFLSVVIVSDTEIELTLIGIVNDSGEVEFIPASGYITVTDSKSGVYTTIEIVETNVVETTPSEPEIEEEEDDEPTKEPVEEVEKPEETEPTEPETEVPENDYIPVVVKINAPETMYYAEPIIITLEGAKAENLVFGNDDFLSVVIISDTEIEVTLIGIVNESGEVEFIPASGYITVTDSKSGVYTTIEIVEAPVTETEPKEEEPEIEEEVEDEVIDTPVEEVEKPEETQPVIPVNVKINAPEVMYYAEPITITLEGIKAENLKFSDEDFLSVVIISDTEIEVTLIGIVNDAGEVELAPACGYIKLTDSVSGVHVVIEVIV